MFQISYSNSPQMRSNDLGESDANLRIGLVNLFTKRKTRGLIKRIFTLLTRGNYALSELSHVLRGTRVLSRHFEGIRSVGIDQIQGSEGKSSDFDRSFNPLHDYIRSRWLNIAWARMAGRVLPAIELIQIGDIFFVRDGHHRISVARAFGEKYLDAEVTKWELQPLGQNVTFSKSPGLLLDGDCM